MSKIMLSYLKGICVYSVIIASIFLSIFSIASGEEYPVLSVMEAELQRTIKELKLPDCPSPYFASCSLSYKRLVFARAALGSIVSSGEQKYADLKVTIRVGDYKLDNTNFISR